MQATDVHSLKTNCLHVDNSTAAAHEGATGHYTVDIKLADKAQVTSDRILLPFFSF
jgi:hypothetical protein